MNILITGASSAIGKKLSEELCKQDDKTTKIILTSRSQHFAPKEAHSGSVKCMNGIDLLNEDHIAQLTKECEALFDGQFHIVHSVGDFWDHVPFTDVGIENAGKIMDSHYTTLYGVLQHLIPLMIKKGGGKIVTFSCNSVRFNYPWMAPFTAAKAAVEALVKCVANEYSKDNIVANVVALSSVQTEAVKRSKPHGDFEHYVPLNAVAETVLETLSMSNIMNGNVISCFTHSDSFFNEGYFKRIQK